MKIGDKGIFYDGDEGHIVAIDTKDGEIELTVDYYSKAIKKRNTFRFLNTIDSGVPTFKLNRKPIIIII